MCPISEGHFGCHGVPDNNLVRCYVQVRIILDVLII